MGVTAGKERRIVMIGLDRAGKSTILYQLKLVHHSTISSHAMPSHPITAECIMMDVCVYVRVILGRGSEYMSEWLLCGDYQAWSRVINHMGCIRLAKSASTMASLL